MGQRISAWGKAVMAPICQMWGKFTSDSGTTVRGGRNFFISEDLKTQNLNKNEPKALAGACMDHWTVDVAIL